MFDGGQDLKIDFIISLITGSSQRLSNSQRRENADCKWGKTWDKACKGTVKYRGKCYYRQASDH